MRLLIFSLYCISSFAYSISFSEWKSLNDEQKVEYIQNFPQGIEIGLDPVTTISSTLSNERVAKLKESVLLLSQKLKNYETEMPLEIDDSLHALVGPIKKNVTFYFSDDDFFLGASVRYKQEGCSHYNEQGEFLEKSGYYPTIFDAQKNQCINDDVSWEGSSIINEYFVEIFHNDFLEWSGY